MLSTSFPGKKRDAGDELDVFFLQTEVGKYLLLLDRFSISITVSYCDLNHCKFVSKKRKLTQQNHCDRMTEGNSKKEICTFDRFD